MSVPPSTGASGPLPDLQGPPAPSAPHLRSRCSYRRGCWGQEGHGLSCLPSTPQHLSCSPHFQPGSAYRVPLLQLPGGPTGGQRAAPGSLYPPSAHIQTLPGSPCCHHCPGAGQPLCRTVADAPAGPCILRRGGSQDGATAIVPPQRARPRVPTPPDGRAPLLQLCPLPLAALHDVLVLLGHLWGHWPPRLPEGHNLGGAEGAVKAQPEPADTPILFHRAQLVGTHLPL